MEMDIDIELLDAYDDYMVRDSNEVECTQIEKRILFSKIQSWFSDHDLTDLFDACQVCKVIFDKNRSVDGVEKHIVNLDKFIDLYSKIERYPSRKRRSQETLNRLIEDIINVVTNLISKVEIESTEFIEPGELGE